MVLISYHWLHDEDGTIWTPSQLKSGRRDQQRSTAIGGLDAHQDTTMPAQDGDEDHQPGAMSRRSALAAAAVAPIFIGPAAAAESVAQLVARAAEKNAAFMRGDMQRWSELVHVAADFTLMQPFGGAARRGDMSPARMAEMARFFRNGKTDLELVQTCACEDIVVLVMIERQSAEVGGLPEQDWSLRVTEVYRKADSEWQLVHRHADPLVRPVTLAQAAALARGSRAHE